MKAGTRHPWSVAATAGVRMGDARGAEGAASMVCAGRVGGTRTIAPSSGNVGEPPLHRHADAQPARPWRGCAGRYFRVPEFREYAGRLFRCPPPVARRRDRRRADEDARRHGKGRIHGFARVGRQMACHLPSAPNPGTPASATSQGRRRAGMCLHDRGAVGTGIPSGWPTNWELFGKRVFSEQAVSSSSDRRKPV
jgi:hypothetical protein